MWHRPKVWMTCLPSLTRPSHVNRCGYVFGQNTSTAASRPGAMFFRAHTRSAAYVYTRFSTTTAVFCSHSLCAHSHEDAFVKKQILVKTLCERKKKTFEAKLNSYSFFFRTSWDKLRLSFAVVCFVLVFFSFTRLQSVATLAIHWVELFPSVKTP